MRQILRSKHFSGAYNPVERRSHFVAHGGEKLALRFACRLGFSACTLRLCSRAFSPFAFRVRLSALHLDSGFFRRPHGNQLLLKKLSYIECRRPHRNERAKPHERMLMPIPIDRSAYCIDQCEGDQTYCPRDIQIPETESKPVPYRDPGVHEQHNSAFFSGETKHNRGSAHVNRQGEKANHIGAFSCSINPGENDEGVSDETPTEIPNPDLRTPIHPSGVG